MLSPPPLPSGIPISTRTRSPVLPPQWAQLSALAAPATGTRADDVEPPSPPKPLDPLDSLLSIASAGAKGVIVRTSNGRPAINVQITCAHEDAPSLLLLLLLLFKSAPVPWPASLLRIGRIARGFVGESGCSHSSHETLHPEAPPAAHTSHRKAPLTPGPCQGRP